MSNLSDAIICTGVDIIKWNDKKTAEPREMFKANTLSDFERNDRSIGYGFIVEDLPDGNSELVKRLYADYTLAVSKGYDFLYIIPHYKRSARGRGEGKSILGDYELAGYGNFQRSPIDPKQPGTDAKQPVKS